jgi:hypothetical protein
MRVWAMVGVFQRLFERFKPSIPKVPIDQKIAAIPQRNPAKRVHMKANHEPSIHRSGKQRLT